MRLSTAQLDRAAGVLVAQGCGDALGVPYEFGPRLSDTSAPEMRGGGLGPYEPGEYSDDTQMAVCIAEVLATGARPDEAETLDAIAERFEAWVASGATDVGTQTRTVLSRARRRGGAAGTRLHDAAAELHRETGHTAGNGALMRCAPVALACLGDDDAIARSARAVAELTHADPLAGDACVLWCVAIDRAVREARLDGVREGLDLIRADRRDQWAAWLTNAEESDPSAFRPNGFTVTALQAAWSAITHTPIPADVPAEGSFPCVQLQAALTVAVRIGDDTDTVAAITGALLGARWGVSAVPAHWRRRLHGWPSMRSRDVARLGILIARHGADDSQGWPSCPRLDYGERELAPLAHPVDSGVLLGTVRWSVDPPVDAVVSLCRLGRGEVPAKGVSPDDHVEVWLVDSSHGQDNPNLAFVIDDAAKAVEELRREGKRVLLHCVRAENRTPIVAARYSMVCGTNDPEQALEDVCRALRRVGLNPTLRDAYFALSGRRDRRQ